MKTIGLTSIKIKILEIEETVDVYIIDGEEFKYDFLIGLDIIQKFKLVQDENLKITQKEEKVKLQIDEYPTNTNEKKNMKQTHL